MTEDIVEFGASPRPKPKPKRALVGRPQWLSNPMLPVASVGALAGAGSLILPWQKLVFRPEDGAIRQTDQTTVETALISLGAYSTGYLLALIGTITAIAMIFYGQQAGQTTARVLGTALSGINLVILVAVALVFNRGTVVLNVGFITFGPEEWENTTVSLDWGFYAALAAVVALGVAAVRAQPMPRTEDVEESGSAGEGDVPAEEHDAEADDGVIDLSVSVHPVGKQVAAG
jgi:hypothetical protein